jgi:YesN/AraC family two-component response regulator
MEKWFMSYTAKRIIEERKQKVDEQTKLNLAEQCEAMEGYKDAGHEYVSSFFRKTYGETYKETLKKREL